MKKIFLILTVSFSIALFSQDKDLFEKENNWQLLVSQDSKLAFIGDNIGNDAWTWDNIIKIKHYDSRKRIDVNLFYALSYEYADLSIAYHRAVFGIGMYDDINNLFYKIFKKELPFPVEVSQELHAGIIARGENWGFTYGGDTEIIFHVHKNIGIGQMLNTTYRVDWADDVPKWKDAIVLSYHFTLIFEM